MKLQKSGKQKIIFLATVGLIFALATPAMAAGGDLFSAGESLLGDTADFIKTISHVAVIIGVGTGALMKKFSLGDPQKIATGSKIIVGSIVGWAVINGIDLILNLLKNYM